MDTERILNELTHYERLPVDAIRAAAADRQKFAPRFIEAFGNYVDSAGSESPEFLFLAFHLLGDWRERSAYRPLGRFLRMPPDDVDRVLGGSITESSNRVMAAVFDGDPQPLYDVILDPGADEYIRSRMCEALAMVTLRGEMPREETVRFLRACFTDLKPAQDCFVWNGWQSAIAILALQELKPLVKQAFDRSMIPPELMEFRHFEEDLQWALDHPDTPHLDFEREYTLWGDSVSEFSTWYGFSEEYFKDKERWASRSSEPQWIAGWDQQPAVNPYKDVGRNDPCPCGSGKKYKKCCLRNAA